MLSSVLSRRSYNPKFNFFTCRLNLFGTYNSSVDPHFSADLGMIQTVVLTCGHCGRTGAEHAAFRKTLGALQGIALDDLNFMKVVLMEVAHRRLIR